MNPLDLLDDAAVFAVDVSHAVTRRVLAGHRVVCAVAGWTRQTIAWVRPWEMPDVGVDETSGPGADHAAPPVTASPKPASPFEPCNGCGLCTRP